MPKATASILLIALFSSIATARAAEGSTGVYLLGMKGQGAALAPPPGLYYQNDSYFYRGSLGGSRVLPTGGRFASGVDADAFVNLSTLLWSTPWQFGGGRLGLSATLPVGRKSLDASLVTDFPRLGGGSTRGRSDALTTYGDPSLGANLSWRSGRLFWQTGLSVNVPVGDYRRDRLANVSFNRWGTDLTTAVTWLDVEKGRDLSLAAGYTVNGSNHATDYRSGDELHLEAAASQYLSPAWSLSLLGYHYQQVSGDSGSGALLGPFKGRTSAIGAGVSYSFQAGGRAISTRLKYFHETAVENRARSNNLFLTVSLPLSTKE
ncbi:transporter [Stenotrophomonas sp. 24(2023)]|uniref:SphA family protein n=1 Tax=Stenotrophomonas sp. 24(2023) TaxID=3068324 RepID=UPI0027E13480|nr:transporter [Stenotrophomonas sp. 24(2023)]WMJ71221.1 transporter [Stenotrophomonas sp. 24(2023)]